MTNKEAIEILESGEPLEEYMPCDEFKKEYATWIEALDRAIKALEFIEENVPKTFDDYLTGGNTNG